MQTVNDIGSYLSAHQIRPSYPRIRIMQYLLERRSHPTIDEIYNALLPEIPTLSKTTVYNTLNLFIRENVAQPLAIEENQTRYDADVSVHGHFRCRVCGLVYDFGIDYLLTAGLNGFTIEARNVYFKGICPACAGEKTPTAQPDLHK